MATDINGLARRASHIISDAGGEIVGRTRLQKIAYFLEILGEGEGFQFGYKHYGPYSDDLSIALSYGRSLGVLREDEQRANWGGFYSIFSAQAPNQRDISADRKRIIEVGRNADPVELELAATAAFFALRRSDDPWSETAKRKPEKASRERLAGAKQLYRQLRAINPDRLPELRG